MLTTILNYLKFNVNLGKSTRPRPLPTPNGTNLIYFKGLNPQKKSYTSEELNEAFLKAKK